MTEYIEKQYDDVVPIIFKRGVGTERNLNVIEDVIATGQNGKWELSAAFAVLFEGVVPQEERDRFGVIIEIEDQNQDFICDYKMKRSIMTLMKTYLSQNWKSGLRKTIYQCEKAKEKMPISAVSLLAGSSMLVNALEWSGVEEEKMAIIREKFILAIQKIAENSENYGEGQAVSRIFSDLLRASVQEGILHVTEFVGADVEVEGRKTILYDEKFYYLTDETFREICKHISFTSQKHVRQILAEEGVLCTEGSGRLYYTKKLQVSAIGAGKRFLWLKRDRIDEPFGLTLEEMRGEK